MELGLVGLGRMGANMTERLIRAGHRVVVNDIDPAAVDRAAAMGAAGASSVSDLAGKLLPPRAVWVMVPSGAPTESTINTLADSLQPNDIVIDGGNSNYKESMRRAAELRQKEIHFVDSGTSGGIWGLREGYCLMIGGEKEPVERLRPIFESLAPAKDRGWAHVGPAGAGHFTKMIHNGIEYGMMQAYAEGFALLHNKEEFGLDIAAIAEVWRHGSVVRSWLLDLTAEALAQDSTLDGIRPYVMDSGEGRWTVEEAIEQRLSAPVITLSLMERFRSRDENSFTDRLLAVMRNKFGGHDVKKS
jgi:6-phosphogluconate dehydrogenase